MSIAHKITDTESNRPSIIHILGASGGGTTTLGRALAERFGYTLLDTDDFFWLPTDPKYTTPRPVDERRRLLEEAVNAAPRCVISGSMTSWGDIFRSRFDFVIVVETPTPVRIERLLQREFAHFGERIQPGGDMYKNHQEFIAWASRYDTAGLEQRSRAMHEAWLQEVTCPIITVNGTIPIDEMIEMIVQEDL
jgi:adenylate kinase family enzyme